MQTLKERNTYTPADASQVLSNCDGSLNREETLSVARLKTSFNNPEVNQPQQAEGRKAKVPVLSVDGKPLMPCTPAKARKLLKAGKATVVKRKPFIIKLNFKCENKTQPITLGIDNGYLNIGFSCTAEKEELISGIVTLDNKTAMRLTERKMYRRGRRNKLRYRQPRFLNRKKGQKWLPPSVQRRIDAHLHIAKNLSELLPITKIVSEVASFDIQKINNPGIEGKEYQQGSLYDYENKKAFVIAREQGKCQLCGEEMDNEGWHLHHIIERVNGGTDKPNNLALLHKKCHKKLHRKGMKLNPNKQFKAETFMSISRYRIVDGLRELFPDVRITYGYKTKVIRNIHHLPKTHSTDAFVIAGGTTQDRCSEMNIIQKHKNNRSLGYQRKGFAPASRKQRYNIQPMDLVWIDGQEHIAKGMMNLGKTVLLDNKKTVGIKKIEKVYNYGTFVYR